MERSLKNEKIIWKIKKRPKIIIIIKKKNNRTNIFASDLSLENYNSSDKRSAITCVFQCCVLLFNVDARHKIKFYNFLST